MSSADTPTDVERTRASLRYRDDADRSFGAAGMAIGLVVFEGDDVIAGVSLDNADHDILELADGWDTPPAALPLTVKQQWQLSVRKFRMATAMAVGNVMCRAMAGDVADALSAATRSLLFSLAREEGARECMLDDDEVEQLFNKEYIYLQQVFRHSRVQAMARDLAFEIHSHRHLTRSDILMHLRALAML